MATKIIVPVNGSECSLKAVDRAIRVAGTLEDARIHLVNVQPTMSRYIARFTGAKEREALRMDRSRHCMTEALRRTRAADVPVQSVMLQGDIVDCIAAYADAQHAHLIIVATQQDLGMSRVFKQPLADRLIQRANVPVEVVSAGPASALERYGLPMGLGAGLTVALLAAE